jgi:hypothetical protein
VGWAVHVAKVWGEYAVGFCRKPSKERENLKGIDVGGKIILYPI